MKQVLSIADQFGALLQASRKSAGMTQTELARHLGLSQSRLSALELNASSIRLDQLLTLCSALDLELLVQTKGGNPPGPAAASTPSEW
jgi:HTH-type transcriptional regulator / antitoxin HipB